MLLAKLGRNEHGVARKALPALVARRDDPSEPVRVVAEGTVKSDAVRNARHAVYDGDMRALLLTQEEHGSYNFV